MGRPPSIAAWCAALTLVGACGGEAQPPGTGPPLAVLSEAAPDAPPAAADPDELLSAEISTVGWDGLTGAPVVLLRELGSGEVVPIWVGLAEAQAIARALHEVVMPRPMTHDLMIDVLRELDAELVGVRVHDLRDGVYYGELELRVPGHEAPLIVDTRPSDGLALALRSGAVISVARKLLEGGPEYEFLAPEGEQQVVRSLGLTVVSTSPGLREELGLPDREGLVVVRAQGAAAEAGLARGDLVVGVNGSPVARPMDLLDAIVATPWDERVRIRYWRDGEEAEVELDQRPVAAPDDKYREIA